MVAQRGAHRIVQASAGNEAVVDGPPAVCPYRIREQIAGGLGPRAGAPGVAAFRRGVWRAR